MKRRYILFFAMALMLVSLLTLVSCDMGDPEDPYGDDDGPYLEYMLLDDDTYGVSMNKTANVKEVNVPSTYKGKYVTKILDDGFRACSKITKVTLPDTIKEIGGYAFKSCKMLEKIEIPASVTVIGEGAFHDCPKLDELSFAPDSKLETIGRQAFWFCAALTSVDIPEGVTTINYGAFGECSELIKINIPSSVTSVGDDLFVGCDKLSYKEYGNALYLGNLENPYVILVKAKNEYIESCSVTVNTKIIYYDAFKGCSQLKSVSFVNNSKLISIESSAFAGCTSLESISIPSNTVSIGEKVFSGCTALTGVSFERSTGWSVSENIGAVGAPVALGTPEQNALLFTDTYKNFYWKRG